MRTSKVYVVSFSIFDKNHFIKPKREPRTVSFLVTKISRKSYLIFFISDLHVVGGFMCYFDSWQFIKPNIESRKTPLLVTKRNQKSYVICFFDPWPPDCRLFDLLLLTHHHFIKPKTEKRKIPFLVTKRSQNSYPICFSYPRPPKL